MLVDHFCLILYRTGDILRARNVAIEILTEQLRVIASKTLIPVSQSLPLTHIPWFSVELTLQMHDVSHSWIPPYRTYLKSLQKNYRRRLYNF